MARGLPHRMYLVSEGTCRTCYQVVRSVLTHFEDTDIGLVWKMNILTADAVADVIKEARADRAVVFYTFATKETREAIRHEAQKRLVPIVDILGPVFGSLYDLYDSLPLATPGMLYKSNKEHFDRIDAVEYTLSHDDGSGIHELSEADVVLVGVSRASKSTTCFYLAYRGVRVANVPLFADSPLPPELLKLDPKRVIGLTTNPQRLRSVREARLRGWGMDLTESYADASEIARELRTVHDQMVKYGWRTIDVSYKAIEEVAGEVMQLLDEAGITVGERDSEKA